MNQIAACTNCGQQLSIPPTLAGRKVSCPKCGFVFVIPGGEVLSLDDDPPPQAPQPPRTSPPRAARPPAPAAPPAQGGNPFAFDTGPASSDDDHDDGRPARRQYGRS